MRVPSGPLKKMLTVAHAHGLCCVALVAWIRHRGYPINQLADLTDAQCVSLAREIRERFDLPTGEEQAAQSGTEPDTAA